MIQYIVLNLTEAENNYLLSFLTTDDLFIIFMTIITIHD